MLNWSENAAKARRLQEEIIVQKQLLDSIDIDNEWVLNSEEAIREKIHELNVSLWIFSSFQIWIIYFFRLCCHLQNAHNELYKYRSNMLKLNAAVHSWLTRQELNRNQVVGVTLDGEEILEQTTQSDLSAYADDELHKHLKDEIVSVYAKWDAINANISTRLESLKDSLVCWTKFEKGLEELQLNLSKDRGALNGLKGAIEEGKTSPEELVDNVQLVSKLLSEKLENRIHTISTNEDFMLHPEAALKFIARSSSNGSYLSDSGISDEGFSELSERERRLNALKKIAKQLESALSPSSQVLKTITQRMEAAENELKILQSTCRELILRTSTQLLKQQGIDISAHAQSQINVQIPIITIKNKSKRSLPRRGRKRSSPISLRKSSDLKLGAKSSTEDTSESDLEEPKSWGFLRRVAKLAVPFQLTVLTLFCIACFFEPR